MRHLDVDNLKDAAKIIGAETRVSEVFVLDKTFLDEAWSDLIVAAHRVAAEHADLLGSLPQGTKVQLSCTGESGCGWGGEPDTRKFHLTLEWPMSGEKKLFKVALGRPSTAEFQQRLGEEILALKELIKAS